MSRFKLFSMAVAIGSVAAALAVQGGVLAKPQVPIAPAPKHFALELDGQMAGYLQNFQPGPTTNPNGTNPSLTPGTMNIQFGISEAGPLLDWINSLISNKQVRKNGSIIACNFNYEATARLDFIGGMAEEWMIPSLDANYSMPGFVVVKVRPERTFPRRVRGPKLNRPVDNRQKVWLCSNFRIRIGDLPCSRVTKIDALAFKRGGPFGINLHFNSADAAAWQAKVNAPGAPIPGKLEFLATDKTTVLATLDFKLLRVRQVQPSNYGPGPDGQPRSIAWTAISDAVLSIAP